MKEASEMKLKLISYFETKIKNISVEKIEISNDVISLIDKLCEKIPIHIYLNESENRISCLIDDLEIVDEFNSDIDEVIQYVDFIISNEILRFEVYCNGKLVKRYYEFCHYTNGKIQKIKLYSANRFVLFGDKKKVFFKFKPW